MEHGGCKPEGAKVVAEATGKTISSSYLALARSGEKKNFALLGNSLALL
jgi:hypothetical protein